MISITLSALADHLWQSTLFAGFAGLLAFTLRNNRARVRYWVWLTASWKFLFPLSVLFALGARLHRWAKPALESNFTFAWDQVGQPFSTSVISPLAAHPPVATGSFIPALLAMIWACGFLAITWRWWIRWRRIRAAVRTGSPIQMDLPIRVVTSPTLLGPGVFGIFRPVLLLPEGILARLTPAQMNGVLAHELSHVCYRDNLTTALHMCVETVFWFHPLVWWIGTRMVYERERACDEDVLSLGADPHAYAESILKVCKLYLETRLDSACGISGSDLTKRIAAIAANRIGLRLSAAKKIALGMIAGGALMVPLTMGLIKPPAISAQAAPAGPSAQAFEVASVKPCTEEPGNGGRAGGGSGRAAFSPGRLDLGCQPLRSLIRIAYIRANFRATGGDSLQLEGGPSWIDAKHYLIVAKADGPAPIAAMEGPMLQRLLEDRFHLKTHRETRESSVYALSVARGGLKIKPTASGSCVVRDSSDTGFIAPSPGEKPYCGEAGIAMSPYQFKFTLAAGTMHQLALNLGPRVGRPVLDKTGIDDKFDFHLEFAPNGADPSDERTAQSIFSALADIGLRLEAAKGPRDYLVIDHVEQPTGN